MTESTASSYQMEFEQLRAASTLVVTVKSSDEFHDNITEDIGLLEHGDSVGATPTLTLSFTSYDDLMEMLTPRVLELLKTARREEPFSINETARIVNRDLKASTRNLFDLPNWESSSLRRTVRASVPSSGSTNPSSTPRSILKLDTWRLQHCQSTNDAR